MGEKWLDWESLRRFAFVCGRAACSIMLLLPRYDVSHFLSGEKLYARVLFKLRPLNERQW